MFIGIDFFQGQCWDGNILSDTVYRLELTNSIVDKIKIDKGNSVQYNTTFSDWGLYTQLLCDFKDSSLEAGNITLSGMPVEYIRIKKRKQGELTWQSYKDIPFVKGQQDYKWSDKFIQALTDYEYAVLPVGAGYIEGIYAIKSAMSDYENIFLLGSNGEQYELIANINKGDIQTFSPSNFIETLGSKYPYEISNGLVDYRKGSLRATLISDSTLDGNNGSVDRKAEKILKENFYKFLTNKKAKVYKDSDGDYILVSIKADSVKIIPNNDLSRSIADLSFDFYEISDVNNAIELQNAGLL